MVCDINVIDIQLRCKDTDAYHTLEFIMSYCSVNKLRLSQKCLWTDIERYLKQRFNLLRIIIFSNEISESSENASEMN